MDWLKAVPKVLRLVRKGADPAAGYADLRSLGAATMASPLWRRLPSVDAARDVAAAATWLQEELGKSTRASTRGIYLGLDTLNMAEGAGHNVEIGGSSSADPSAADLEWIYGCEWYGRPHLIRGLLEMQQVYRKTKGKILAFADYALFLGYSGLVLASAIERVFAERRSGPRGRLFAWGFHDGDIYSLCRVRGGRVERLAQDA